MWNEAHSRSFMVAGAASQALVGDFRAAVARAIETGSTLADFRKAFDGIVEKHGWSYNGTPGWRSQIIYETNLSMAYSAGRYAQMIEPDTLQVFPYWQYQHTSSARPRPKHLAWVGTTLPHDDPWWATHYPPNGWRCRCSVRPVSAAGLARQGKSGPDTAPTVRTSTFRSRDGRGGERGAGRHRPRVRLQPGGGLEGAAWWRRRAGAAGHAAGAGVACRDAAAEAAAGRGRGAAGADRAASAALATGQAAGDPGRRPAATLPARDRPGLRALGTAGPGRQQGADRDDAGHWNDAGEGGHLACPRERRGTRLAGDRDHPESARTPQPRVQGRRRPGHQPRGHAAPARAAHQRDSGPV